MYKPWRRRIDQKRRIHHRPQRVQEDEELGPLSGLTVAADSQEREDKETNVDKSRTCEDITRAPTLISKSIDTPDVRQN